MGFVDKLKNLFFEEEEEEEIEDTRPLRKIREKEKTKEIEKVVEKEPKVEKEIIAKKVELPKRKKEEVIEQSNVEEITYEAPKKAPKVEEYVELPKETRDVEKPTVKKESSKINNMIFDDEDFLLNDIKPKEESKAAERNYRLRDTYQEKEVREKESSSYEYRKKEEKPKGFTPSPIISPIYGILDKNYKKEEVKEKKEIRITSRVSRVDLDSVRNKAFGDLENDLFPGSVDDEDDNQSETPNQNMEQMKENIEDDGKPVVEKVTLGEADEYYSDLGLAYNTDYKDISKEINDGKVKTKKKDEGERLEDNLFDLIEERYDRED